MNVAVVADNVPVLLHQPRVVHWRLVHVRAGLKPRLAEAIVQGLLDVRHLLFRAFRLDGQGSSLLYKLVRRMRYYRLLLALASRGGRGEVG